jgi:glycosyltransferase involved in cell wall biosynthesis
MNVLFVTWDGPQVSYLEGLFVPAFQQLANAAIKFHVLQFTWDDEGVISTRRRACADAGIPYERVKIWRRPAALGPFLSATLGARHIVRAVGRHQIDVLMPRSTLPALASLIARRRVRRPLIFDADGLPIDERIEFAGRSPTNLGYRVQRDIEAMAVRLADAVTVRTPAAIEILLARAGAGTRRSKFAVVRNGRDATLFAPASPLDRSRRRQAIGVPEGAPLLAYAGSVGPQYCIEETLRLFRNVRARRPDAVLLVLTAQPSAASAIVSQFPELMAATMIRSVPAAEVAAWLACADVGLGLRRPSFSMQAVAPIKIGEYLLCGLPLIATRNIGDTNGLGDCAFLVQRLDDEELQAAARWFVDVALPDLDALRARSRAVGLGTFSRVAAKRS